MSRPVFVYSSSMLKGSINAHLRNVISTSSHFSKTRHMSTTDINYITTRMLLGTKNAYCFKQMSGHAAPLLL